ncbi:MAG TPA: tRNA pseudouridine(38-40) synthase TruA [Clostridiales bacterium]|nr:tRNA pseudouridine(38-40) synthase TruA [Clostridiales bacterium]
MKRIYLKIAYDGTNYKGWQKQPNAITIEGMLNNKLSKILGEKIEIIGASRTDSGVHALCNVAVFDTETKIPANRISLALNRRLPRDIVIQESKEVSPNFHPRDCKSIKTYEYQIFNNKCPLPTRRLYHYFVHHKLNIEDMKKAAKYLVGAHDFKSFCLKKTKTQSTVRTIYSIDIEKNNDLISITVKGNGFLYNMVRGIVGTLIYVARGVYPPEYVKEILEKKDRKFAGPNAPAHGLNLIDTKYLEEEVRLKKTKQVNLKKI